MKSSINSRLAARLRSLALRLGRVRRTARLDGGIQIPREHEERLRQLAEYRGESLEACVAAIAKNVVTRIPKNLRDADRPLTDLKVADVGISEDGDPYIRLKNGRIFYGYFSKHRHVLMYHLMCDQTPKAFKPDTYALGIEVRKRYCQQPPKHFFPAGQNAVAVDAGAYVGYKALAFLDALGPQGKVIAIELEPENFRLLKRNVEENGLQDRVRIHNVGIWNEPGRIPMKGKGWSQFSIADMDGKDYPDRGFVRTDTLDNIFDRSDVERIDYLNIQVNGAEIQTLQGLQRWFDRVHVIRIAAYYKRDGVAIADEVERILRDRGAEIVQRAQPGSILAVNPAFQGTMAESPAQRRKAG
ncbi:MAG: FkbM family methyltransferase [Planctomycetales bacterium]